MDMTERSFGVLVSASEAAGGGSGGSIGELDRLRALAVVDLGELVRRPGEADLKALDLAHPAVPSGFFDAGGEVVADVDEPGPLGRVGPQQGAAHTGVLVDAGGAEGAGAGPDGDLAPFEVAEELLPFVSGGGAVFLAGAQGAPAGQEREVGVDGFLRVDGFVAHGHVQVFVPGEDLG